MYPTKKIGEIGIFNRGITYNKGDLLESYQIGCITLLRANNINDGLFLDDLQYLPGGFVKSDKILQKDDIIFCMSSGSKHLVGKNAIVSNGDNFSFGAFCSMFRKNTNDDINYISYYLKSNLYKNYIFNFSQGVNILNLKNSDLENCEIPLPPLTTQKLIVQKLDSAFENIDKNINLTKENLKNLEELNKSVLEKVFSEGEYEMKTIEDSLEFLTDYHANGSYEILRDNVELKDIKDYALMIRPTDLENNNFIDGVKYISENAYNFLSKTKVFGNEIIIPKIGSIGNFYLMPELNIPISLGMNIFMLKINSNNFSKYIYYYLISEVGKKEILSRAQGAVTKTITKIAVKTIPIPLPPLQKQKEIVSYLDEVFAKNKELKTKYELQLKELEELKQSLLKDAFEGRLVKE